MSLPAMPEILQNPEIYRQGPFRMGLWRGKVVSTADPQRRGRVQVRIYQLHPVPGAQEVPVSASNPAGGFKSLLTDAEVRNVTPGSAEAFDPMPETQEGPSAVAPPGEGISDRALPWAEPCFPFGGRRRTADDPAQPPNSTATKPGPDGNLTEGFFSVPTVGSTVWLAFENNFTGRPVYLGTWYGSGELPEEIPPLPFDPADIKLLKTAAGHILLFDDAVGQERIFLGTFDKDEATKTNHLRFLEMKDSDETVTLRQTSQDEAEEQQLNLDLPNKLVELVNKDLSSVLRLLLDVGNQKVTLELEPQTSIVIEPDKITVTSGSQSIELDNLSGDMDVTATGNVTISCVDATINATGDVNLGTGAVSGVVLDTLKALFDAHVHTITGGSSAGLTTPPTTSVILGTHTSLTVKAKV